ncbi:MAG: cardiolipin synthase ClsB [Comamonadaceae bacterium]|nr:MAG: cardiolipin synthase ClsB [Comamonadaceae bacterium]
MKGLFNGHKVQLLCGSSEYFAALVDAMDGAEFEVRLETYIFDFTGSGADVAEALIRTATRGVCVMLVVDGFGTGMLPAEWRQRFDEAGVQWRIYRLPGRFGLLLPSSWRRLHRKLCVVDGEVAFCGGINILDDLHDPNHGTLEHPRFDYALRASGPLVGEVEETMSQLWDRLQGVRRMKQRDLPAAWRSLRDSMRKKPPSKAPELRAAGPAGSRAALVLRDNLRHRGHIEKTYRHAIGTARREVILANAYFVPGVKLRRALVEAARRGVKVQLLLQGKYEYFMQYYAARPVYDALLKAGVEIYEYSPSFLHAKVAVVDGHWATVGSSNLDPLSLLLAREANVVVEDEAFAGELREALVQAMRHERRMDAAVYAARPRSQRLKENIALALMRFALFVQGKRY